MTLKLLLLMGLASPLALCHVFGQADFKLCNYWVDYDRVTYFFPVHDWLGNPLEGSDWRAELYGGPTADSLSPAQYSPMFGRVLASFTTGGLFFTPPGKAATVFDTNPAGWAWLQVKVWDIRLGATFEEAAAKGCGGYGQSELFYARGAVWGRLELPQPLRGLTSFSVLEPVPDPPTTGLLAVGGAALAWHRHVHKKHRTCCRSP